MNKLILNLLIIVGVIVIAVWANAGGYNVDPMIYVGVVLALAIGMGLYFSYSEPKVAKK